MFILVIFFLILWGAIGLFIMINVSDRIRGNVEDLPSEKLLPLVLALGPAAWAGFFIWLGDQGLTKLARWLEPKR